MPIYWIPIAAHFTALFLYILNYWFVVKTFFSHLLDEDDIDSVSMRPSCVSPSLKQTLVSRLQLTKPEKKNPRSVKVKLSVTKTDFVVLEDITSLDSNAVVLKVHTYICVCKYVQYMCVCVFMCSSGLTYGESVQNQLLNYSSYALTPSSSSYFFRIKKTSYCKSF